MSREERGSEVANEAVERPSQCLPPRDENIVIARQPIKGKDRLRRRPQPPLGPIPGNCIADFAAGSEADAGCAGGCLGGRAKLNGQAGGNPPDASCRSQEFWAFRQAPDRRHTLRLRDCRLFGVCQAESFLRPWARRRASTLRPPTVDMRALKPCRRLRTILLG